MAPKFLDKSFHTVLHNIVSIDQFGVDVGKYRVETGSPFDKVKENCASSKKRFIISRETMWKIPFQLPDQSSLSTSPFDKWPRRHSPGNGRNSLHQFTFTLNARAFLSNMHVSPCFPHCSVSVHTQVPGQHRTHYLTSLSTNAATLFPSSLQSFMSSLFGLPTAVEP